MTTGEVAAGASPVEAGSAIRLFMLVNDVSLRILIPAERAKGFGMRLAAYDPFVSEERARKLGVELMPLDQIVAESDFLAVHLPKTPETIGLIDRWPSGKLALRMGGAVVAGFGCFFIVEALA